MAHSGDQFIVEGDEESFCGMVFSEAGLVGIEE
jgi:hypothetical protein